MNSEFLNGPCQVLPASEETSSDINQCVKLRIPKDGTAVETMEPMSVPGLINNTVKNYPDHIAYVYKDTEGKSVKVTYKQYLQNVRTCAKAFLALGLERRHGVCILGFNSPEWIISNLAAIFAGGVSSGIYITNNPEACCHCASTVKANIIVVEDDNQCQKITSIRHQLPDLKKIVQYRGEPKDPDVMSWKQLMDIGEQQNDDDLERCLKEIAINQCCSIVFTSGTVGNPKAAMLSHDNLVYDSRASFERLDVSMGEEVLVSYLPLSHVAAQMVDIYFVITAAATIYFADNDALKGTLIQTLQEARPTLFLGVPRVWEKIQEKILYVSSQSGILKKSIANWARYQALKYNFDKMNGKPSKSWGYSVASTIILEKVKQILGLDRCKLVVTAAAPLSPEVKKFFMSLDILLMDSFGMSECGGHCISTPDAFNLEASGRSIPGTKVKIMHQEDGQGELCLYGRHVFMGYLNEPEKTRAILEDDGWLHTGDIGKVDDSGLIYITGRLKELLITAGGENIPPVPIEQMIQAELPNISYAILIGDKKKFLSLLIALKAEVNQDTSIPTDVLMPNVQDWLKSLGCPAKTIKEVLDGGPDAKLLNTIQSAIDKVNAKVTSNAQRIQKFRILPADFSIATGELGPTLKIKRGTILSKYKDIVDSMYS
ncbi:hypothetical protein HHI36_021179 [Cryptolaemus montrouzieri]|uniref:long-chain-fatty-acid--CoA ligase n=1 Tax=Cryptolaemus montrouzieri TaxID=559131 RepID=A0ABD2MWV2_9CUCU